MFSGTPVTSAADLVLNVIQHFPMPCLIGFCPLSGLTLILQPSADSAVFENPFREGGKLSRDAEGMVEAFKQGKLSTVSSGAASGGKKIVYNYKRFHFANLKPIFVNIVILAGRDAADSAAGDGEKQEGSECDVGTGSLANSDAATESLVKPIIRKNGVIETSQSQRRNSAKLQTTKSQKKKVQSKGCCVVS